MPEVPFFVLWKIVATPLPLFGRRAKKVIYGLHLEGARWAEEKGELDEALHKVRTN